jgi:cysteine desulfuration protein SufE
MTINEVQDNIIEEFSLFEDWMDKYNLLIDLGKELPVIDYNGKLITFTADSDAIITRGIVSLLIKVLSNRTPGEIINSDLYFIDKIGLRQNLSPTRSNGLLSMVRQIKLYAMAFDAIKK